jgi:hypothetical protein
MQPSENSFYFNIENPEFNYSIPSSTPLNIDSTKSLYFGYMSLMSYINCDEIPALNPLNASY